MAFKKGAGEQAQHCDAFPLFRDCRECFFCLQLGGADHAGKKEDICGDRWKDRDDLAMFYIYTPIFLSNK